MSVINKKAESDVQISRENQKKINTFAIRNGWLEELKEELKAKKNLLKNLEDAEGDLMLLDDTETVPIFIGETFVHFKQDRAIEQLNDMMSSAKESIGKTESRISEIKEELNGLRRELYAQFGDNINLECEED